MDMLNRRSLAGLFGAAVAHAVCPASAEARPTAVTLFTIARSKNANVVRYRARLDKNGLDLARPIEAYWLMLAEGGHREELTWAERRLAYGFDWSNVTAQHCSLDLSAVKQRRLEVERRDGRFVALLTIAGKRAALERIFVQTSEGGLLPNVQYLDVTGVSSSGGLLRERITPA